MKRYYADLNKNYYVVKNDKLEKITSKEFYEKTKYDKTILNKLKKSVYPWQRNDYIILKFPSWFPNYENNKYIPADYKIANIIKYLWSKKIVTLGWNQPNNKKNIEGFITLNPKKDTIEELIKIFGEDNIEIIDYIKNPSLEPLSGLKGREERSKRTKEWLKLNKKIYLTISTGFLSIDFFEKNLRWIHKKLGIKMPQKKDASKGGIILYDGHKSYKLLEEYKSTHL